MKKICLIIVVSSILCYLIYHITLNNKSDIFIIGDSLSINNNINYNAILKEKLSSKKINDIITLASPNLTIDQVLNKIEKNIIINNHKIQEIIAKSDYIILFIGNDELNYYFSTNQNNKNIETLVNNYSVLLKKITSINSNKIITLGILNEDNRTKSINKQIYKLSVKSNGTYIDTNYLLKSFNNHQNYMFQKEISNKLLQEIKL